MNDIGEITNKEIIIKNIDELGVFAVNFLKEIEEKVFHRANDTRGNVTKIGTIIVGLSGDLGAGKTTFSKVIARELGIQEVVTSPTFGIQKQYQVVKQPMVNFFKEFVHIDAYRIEDIKEVGTLRFIELFKKPNTLIFIEWPEKIAEVLPKETIVLSFESIDENTRKISY